MLTPGVCVRVLRRLTNHVSVVTLLANQNVRTPGVSFQVVSGFVSAFVSAFVIAKLVRVTFQNSHSSDDEQRAIEIRSGVAGSANVLQTYNEEE